MTKTEFEMYRFNVNFPVYNPKLFACVNGGEFVKTALFFNSFSNSRINVLLIIMILSDFFYILKRLPKKPAQYLCLTYIVCDSCSS